MQDLAFGDQFGQRADGFLDGRVRVDAVLVVRGVARCLMYHSGVSGDGHYGRCRAGGSSMNRLKGSISPYLQQHAQNPVHWWPWREDAFAEARRRDVPILLTVGYSACFWCHETTASRKMGPLCSEPPDSLASARRRWPAKATVGRRFRALVYHFVYHRGRNESMWRAAVPPGAKQ